MDKKPQYDALGVRIEDGHHKNASISGATTREEMNEFSKHLMTICLAEVPSDVGVTIFLSSLTAKKEHNFLAYMSNCDRKGMMLTVQEWLTRQMAAMSPSWEVGMQRIYDAMKKEL